MVAHRRIYRKKSVWLSESATTKLSDYITGNTTLHAHSRDAAQQAYFRACKTIRQLRKHGKIDARYPYKRKFYRASVWKNTGIRMRDGVMLLARARGLASVRVALPTWLLNAQIVEVRLVYNHKARHYDWHVVCDEGHITPEPSGNNVIAVDMGEIHPAAACDTEQAVVFSARELRATVQWRNKKLAELAALQSKCQRNSRRWKKLQRVKNQVKGKAKRKVRDINHKVSRAVVDFAVEREAGTIVVGDVRDVADGVNRGKSNQKLSQWAHGQQRQFITYKAARVGMATKSQEESSTTKTCPCCGERNACHGRVYRCHKCGWIGSRDGQVGAPNILSKFLFGELARVQVPHVKYRHPFQTGKRSSSGHLASCLRRRESVCQEAAGF